MEKATFTLTVIHPLPLVFAYLDHDSYNWHTHNINCIKIISICLKYSFSSIFSFGEKNYLSLKLEIQMGLIVTLLKG